MVCPHVGLDLAEHLGDLERVAQQIFLARGRLGVAGRPPRDGARRALDEHREHVTAENRAQTRDDLRKRRGVIRW